MNSIAYCTSKGKNSSKNGNKIIIAPRLMTYAKVFSAVDNEAESSNRTDAAVMGRARKNGSPNCHKERYNVSKGDMFSVNGKNTATTPAKPATIRAC